MHLRRKTSLRRSRASLAFTLTEMMIAASIYVMVIGGIVYLNLIGLKMYQITKAKLGANDDARKGINDLIDSVRAAKEVIVGLGTLTNFTEDATGSNQIGSGLQIYPTTNYSSYVRYYYDTNSQQVRRTTDGASYTVVSQYVTNRQPFTLEDYAGNILTTTQNVNTRVVGLTLQIYQLIYPTIVISNGCTFDYYALHTKITRRSLY